jgi:ParB family transcriptional regulator, chromosome partitioning protein
MPAGASGPTMSFGQKKKKRSIWDSPDAAEVVEIPLKQLHPNPFNPRLVFKEEDIEDLMASIQAEQGLLQDLSVAEVDAFLEFWRERLSEIDPARLAKVEEALGDVPETDYVILIGHNRTIALGRLGYEVATCKITNSKIPRARLLGLPENMRRVALNPIEEARGFREALDDGMTQGDVAAQTGCKQPHISRRIKLLKLPEEIQQAVMDGLAVGEAEALLDGRLTETDQYLQAWQIMHSDGVRADVAIGRVLRPAAPTDDEPGKEGAEQHGQPSQAALPAQADNSNAAAPAAKPATSRVPATRKPQPAVAAAKGRSDACLELLTAGVPANPRDVVRLLAPALVVGTSSTARRLAGRWLAALDKAAPETAQDPFGAVLSSGDGKAVTRVALAMALAVAENRLSDPGHTWDAQDGEYIRLLTTLVSYQPSEWELQQLAPINA